MDDLFGSSNIIHLQLHYGSGSHSQYQFHFLNHFGFCGSI